MRRSWKNRGITIVMVVLALSVLSIVGSDAPCDGIDCSGHGACEVVDSHPRCICEEDYRASGLACLPIETGGDGDGDSDSDEDGDVDSDVDGDADSDTDGDTDVDGDGDADSDADGDTDGDGDGDADSDADGDTDGDGDADADADGYIDGDVESDADGDAPTGPVITGIEGTGLDRDLAFDEDDRATWEAHDGDRSAATQRIDSETPVLVISGVNLGGTTAAEAVGQDEQGTITFIVDSESDEEARLSFPSDSDVTEGGMFDLTLTTAAGDARAEVYFMRGEQGEAGEDGVDDSDQLVCGDSTCSLEGRDVVVDGSIATSEPPECPQGYYWTGEVSCLRGEDEMVRVGDSWVDRYEAAILENEDCTGFAYGVEGEYTDILDTFVTAIEAPIYACSVLGSTPAGYSSWFQAQTLCNLSGERLLTNAEWQAAAAGTPDPLGGSTGEGGTCRTFMASEARVAGSGTVCESRWGCQDMIGDVSEWTAEWWGQGEDAACGVFSAEELEDDSCMNISQAAESDRTSLPPAAGRGGTWGTSQKAGVFHLVLVRGVQYDDRSQGFRCVRGF